MRSRTNALLMLFGLLLFNNVSILPSNSAEQTVSSKANTEKRYPIMDLILGVKFLHDQGLTGKDIIVGVIDVTETGEEMVGKIKGFKGALIDSSDSFSFHQSCHSSHVSGIICGQKIEGRTSVAPDSKVLFKAYLPNDITKKLPIKCEVTASGDWIFEEGVIKKGSKVTIYQPGSQYMIHKSQYVYDDKTWTSDIDKESSIPHPNVYACTGLYGDTRSSFVKDLYPGFVTHIEFVGNEVDDHVSKIINLMNEKGIKIINYSVLATFGPKTLEALRNFAKNGGVFVVAAGNAGNTFSSKGYDNSKRFIRGALDVNFLSTISNNIPESIVLVGNLEERVDDKAIQLHSTSAKAGDLKNHYIAAWGENVPSIAFKKNEEKIERKTETMTGTSQAAPMISGVIADLYQGFPKCTPLQIKNILLKTASTKDLSGTSEDYGMGMLDAKAAYAYLKSNGCS